MHIQRDRHKIACNSFDDLVALGVGAILEQLLTQIIAERISHQLCEVRKCLSKNLITL